MTVVPWLGRLIDDYTGEPEMVRWLSIHPDDTVEEHSSPNTIAWSTDHQIWVQWRLLWEVYREIDPTGPQHGLAKVVVIPTARAVVIMSRSGTGPHNPFATRVLHGLRVPREAHGIAAVLAATHPATGLHGDLDNDQQAALSTLAEQPEAIPECPA